MSVHSLQKNPIEKVKTKLGVIKIFLLKDMGNVKNGHFIGIVEHDKHTKQAKFINL